jgi:hypothetical protein
LELESRGILIRETHIAHTKGGKKKRERSERGEREREREREIQIYSKKLVEKSHNLLSVNWRLSMKANGII